MRNRKEEGEEGRRNSKAGREDQGRRKEAKKRLKETKQVTVWVIIGS
jgi:hypothetical protein